MRARARPERIAAFTWAAAERAGRTSFARTGVDLNGRALTPSARLRSSDAHLNEQEMGKGRERRCGDEQSNHRLREAEVACAQRRASKSRRVNAHRIVPGG